MKKFIFIIVFLRNLQHFELDICVIQNNCDYHFHYRVFIIEFENDVKRGLSKCAIVITLIMPVNEFVTFIRFNRHSGADTIVALQLHCYSQLLYDE